MSTWTRDVALATPPLRPAGRRTWRRLEVWDGRTLRTCRRCDEAVPVVCFSRLRGGRQSWCRRCFAEHRRAGSASAAGQRRRAAVLREAQHAHVLAHLRERPCTDCGQTDPVVLELDHHGPKAGNIADLLGHVSLDRLQQELDRCHVVCVACHRRRTAIRAGWARATADWREALRAKGRGPRSGAWAVLERLEEARCVDCGERDLLLLDLDHVRGRKASAVASLVASGASRRRVLQEAARCEVRCVICHRRRTARVSGSFRARALKSAGPP